MDSKIQNIQDESNIISYKEIGLPQEQMLELEKPNRKLIIGLPKDANKNENRVMLSPQAVLELSEKGHIIVGEAGLGLKSSWLDEDYKASGLKIVSKEEVYKSELILKVSPFRFEDIKLLKEDQTIISALHLNTQTEKKIKALISKKITAIALELIKEEDNFYPFVHSMSEIAGVLAIITASEYLANNENGKGILLGGITGVPPAEIMILGAGTAGESAARTALGLGARVKIFDNSISKLSRLKVNLGKNIYTSVINKTILEDKIKTADVLIGANDNFSDDTSEIISEMMVARMKKGAVIIDLNTDNGSYIETSEPTHLSNPTYTKYGVIHYCVPNIASKTSRTSSIALSNTVLPIINNISNLQNTLQVLKDYTPVRNGIYIYKGVLTNRRIASKFRMDFRDINLISAIL